MGDDFVIDWSWQSVSINSTADVRTTAAIVAERLGIELTEVVNRDGETLFRGPDSSGATVSVSPNSVGMPGMSEQMLADARESAGPEPTSVYVHATSVGHRMVEALSGPPFVLKFLSPHPEERFQRSMHGWDRELPRLRERGWQVDLSCVESPVALEGYLPTGEDFYLRCRHQHCSLEIDEDSANWWRSEVQYEHASWIEPDEAVRVLHELHTVWLNRTPGDHGNC